MNFTLTLTPTLASLDAPLGRLGKGTSRLAGAVHENESEIDKICPTPAGAENTDNRVKLSKHISSATFGKVW